MSMVSRQSVLYLLIVCLWWPGYSTLAWAQAPPATQSAPALSDLGSPVQPDTIAARKEAVQARLEELAKSNLPAADLEATRALLTQILQVLTTLEETWQRRAAFLEHLEGLPQRMQELAETRRKLEAQLPRRFTTVTEEQRHQYDAQVQATQVELQELSQQTAAAEVRLAAIAKALEPSTEKREQLEKDLLALRSKTSEQSRPLDMALLALQRQLLDADVEVLHTESEWLTKSRPLRDALQSVAQTRLEKLQQDLETIKSALGTTIQQEQATLQSTAERLEQQLQQTTDPVEAMSLAVMLETVDSRKTIAEYRQRLNQLRGEILAQEQRNAQVRQDMDRWTSLVEKYGHGEEVAQRLLIAFERVQRERLRVRSTPEPPFEARLRTLTTQMLALDDRLYEFDRQADARLAEVAATRTSTASSEAKVSPIRTALEEQKTVLREQQQVLTDLMQGIANLMALQREYQRRLDDSYTFVRTRMLELQTADALSWTTGRDMVAGAVATARRLQVFVRAERARLWAWLTGAVHLWPLVILLGLGCVWVAALLHRRLGCLVDTTLATAAQRQGPPGVAPALLLVCRAAIWPAFLVLVAWAYGQLLPPEGAPEGALAAAIVSGLQVSALVLWIGLAERALLRPDGWGQRFWGLSPELCRFLRRVVTVGSFAALVLLVPHHILLTAPGQTTTASSSLALSRFLFLTFQMVLMVLVGVVGRRSSPLMTMVLARSREEQGLLWRLWPLAYVALLGGGVAVITLHGLGYLYAARYIWARVLESLGVILVVPLLFGVVAVRALSRLMQYLTSLESRVSLRALHTERVQRAFLILQVIVHTSLALLTMGLILEIWGISVTWLLTLPLTRQFLWRVGVIALVVSLVIGFIQASNALTEYLLQPRRIQGGTRQVGRKLRTLAPLIQTVIRAGAVFLATLVVLEQLGIATGPLLTGVGIFGLAVGFASQSLIKDVINGLFILFEDSLSVGDVVTLRGTSGQVEKVTLRAVTIRDLSGNVHVIPNSIIDIVTNMTKEYSCYVLDIGVAYGENVDRVIGIMREIDEEMRSDPAYGFDMLEPIEVMGVERFDNAAMIIRARLKTRPIQQGRIGREFNHRLKKVFDERGFPFRIASSTGEQPQDGAPPPRHNHVAESAATSPERLSEKPVAPLS